MRFVLVSVLIGLTAVPAFAEQHAPEQVKDAFQRFAAKDVDHEEKIAAVLSSFPKYAALPDRPEVLKKAMELLAPLAEMKFANCNGDLIEMEVVENEAGSHRILQKETTASSYYSSVTESHSHTDSENPFRPLWVDGDFLLAELPGNQALDKKMAAAAVRQFKIMHFHKEDGRTHLEMSDVYLVNGKVISMPPEKLEESSVLKCRTRWAKDAEEGRVSPPRQLKFQKGLEGHTDYARAEDPEQAKAIKLIAEVLGKDGVAVDAVKGLSDEELKSRKKQFAEQTEIKNRVAVLDKQAADEAEKIKVAKAKKQKLETEYCEVVREYNAAQAKLEEAKDFAERRWKTYQDYKETEYLDSDDKSLIPAGNHSDVKWRADLNAAFYTSWGSGKVDSKKLRAAKKALRERMTKAHGDNWYSWDQEAKALALKAGELSKQRDAFDTYAEGSSLSLRTAEAKIIGDGEALLAKIAKEKEEVIKSVAEAMPLAHANLEAARQQNKVRMVSPSIFGKLPGNAKNGDVFVLAPMDKENRRKYSSNSAHFDLLLGKAPFFDVLKIDPKTGEIKERAMLIFTDPKWKKTTMLAGSSVVNTSLMERLKMIWNGDWQKDFLDWDDFKNRDLYLHTANGVDPEPIHLEKLVDQVVAGQKIIANTRKESTPISEVIDAPKVREFFAKHGLSTQESNPNLVYMPALAGTVQKGLVAGVVPNDVVEKFAGNIPKRFAKPLMEKELGKEWLISMYPAAQIKKEMREVAVHEWAHLLDLNQWKVNPVTSDRLDKKKLEEEFERIFPTLVQFERHGRKYKAEFEEFKNDIPADEEKISTFTPEQQQEYIRKEFEKQYFGENQERFKQSLKESYAYLRSPVERIAWAAQIAYLRDIEGMTFDQVLAQTNRIGGAHSEVLSNGMKEQYMRELYEEPNLKKIIERARLEATFLFQ